MLLDIIKLGDYPLEFPKFLFCGSFNPLHEGHIAIMDYIHKRYGYPVDLEISFNNVEKNSIDHHEVRRRCAQIRELSKPSFGRLYMTDDARYLEKAEIFPDVTFVCGYDTMKALADGKYYKEDFNEVIKRFSKLGTKWIVFPRQKDDGTVSSPEDFKDFPEELLKNMEIVTEFQPVNVRSRDIRKRL
jgi:nicotinic acid mononucleotide adenylyltransferase